MNIVELPVTPRGAELAGLTQPLPRSALEELSREGAKTVTFGFRPEAVDVVSEGEGFPMYVDVVEELGSDAYAYGQLGSTSAQLLPTDRRTIIRVDPRSLPVVGRVAWLRIRPGEEHLFSPATGQRLRG
jgi:multiple sugar transport system ATP-binding protein